METLELRLCVDFDDGGCIVPVSGDSVGIVRESGRLSILRVVKVEPTIDGYAVWTSTGEKFLPSQCLAIYFNGLDS